MPVSAQTGEAFQARRECPPWWRLVAGCAKGGFVSVAEADDGYGVGVFAIR
ncbi:MAG: hypothetical protein OXG80_08790 [Chloroflexi bacterium]|nr:hypothetical protein [Chloroflexota bacterium]